MSPRQQTTLIIASQFKHTRKYKGEGSVREAYMIINPAQSAIVEEVYSRFASGESAKDIAEDLEGKGVPSPDRIHWERMTDEKQKKHGDPRPWSVPNVKKMVTKPLYKGWFEYGKFETVKIRHWLDADKTIPELSNKGEQVVTSSEQKRPDRDKGVTWFEFPIEDLRIVSDEVWEQCQTVLRTNKKTVRKQNKSYLLTGRVTCTCGKNYKGSSRKTKSGQTSYYRHTCEHGKLIRAERLEDFVWSNVLNYIYSDESIKRSIARIEESKTGNTARLTSDIDKLTEEIDNMSGQIRSGVKDLLDLQGYAREAQKSLLNSIEGDLVILEGKRGTLKRELDTPALDESIVLERMQVIRTIAEQAQDTERKQIINLLDIKVIVPEDQTPETLTLDDGRTLVKDTEAGLLDFDISVTLLDNVVQSPTFS